MQNRKSKIILIYFFLLLLVGSINNINLNNLKFNEIKDIKIIGLSNHHNSILLEEIQSLNLKNIFVVSREKLVKQINKNSLVEKYEISKNYPSSLNISIEKTKFLAKINNNGKIFVVGSNGKLSKNDSSMNQLPFIFGNPEINEFINFKKNIDQSKFSYDEIKNLYFFSSRRWDLELHNDIIIKLPKNELKDTLNLVYDFLYNNDFRDIKIIDARIKNQIILND